MCVQKINDTPAGETRANPNECEGFVKSVEVTIKACLELVGQLFLHFKQDDTGQYAFATLVLLLKTCFEYVQVLGVGEATIGGLTVFVFTLLYSLTHSFPSLTHSFAPLLPSLTHSLTHSGLSCGGRVVRMRRDRSWTKSMPPSARISWNSLKPFCVTSSMRCTYTRTESVCLCLCLYLYL